MTLAYVLSLDFVIAILTVIGGLTVVTLAALAVFGWLLSRNADAFNRHSSS